MTARHPLRGKKNATGQLGEEITARHLASVGYVILNRNWRCRSGELDLVAVHRGVIVFVEVRTRTSGGRFGTAAESVDYRKQLQVRAVAEVYLHRFGYTSASVRFDVAAITLDRITDEVLEFRHFESAF
ncbi:YraN family protein [Paenibacillus methanolicus]|uniref:UPF0102 protein BCM02_102232 n=1 Tax=Paenibacillus methanolicus TaxID=582686 RepID=A0A5S5CE63_9BACL|nr:YraN family protein [Paenibacillus methanolicus]TYP77671.1 putative endonuclease [Paenibacillus methanolicus]